MIANAIHSVPVIFILLISACFAQNDISAKLTPEAIDARISEIRMGDIIIKTKSGAQVKVEQMRHEFLFGTAVANSVAENHENAMSPEDRKMYLKILEENCTEMV
jgi:endo-1,4-beta-xylanase